MLGNMIIVFGNPHLHISKSGETGNKTLKLVFKNYFNIMSEVYITSSLTHTKKVIGTPLMKRMKTFSNLVLC